MEGSEVSGADKEYSLKEFCSRLSISQATGRNWVRLGKILPTSQREGKPYFSASYTETIERKLQEEETGLLKTRRNKRYISGNSRYRNYIPLDSKNMEGIAKLTKRLENFPLTENQLRGVLAECGIQLLCQAQEKEYSFTKNFLDHYRRGEIDLGPCQVLIQDLLGESEADQRYSEDKDSFSDKGFTADKENTEEELIPGRSDIFQIPYVLEQEVDVLGMIYLSLKNRGQRKASGSYYTPTEIVKKLTENLLQTLQEEGRTDGRFLDPCCGTGNFLLQLPEEISVEQIFGRDIDPIGILLARINLALKYQEAPVTLIQEQIKVQDFLLEEEQETYDVMLGNPPWGFQFETETEKLLREKFFTGKKKHMESYDLFLEQAVRQTSLGGKIAFVLPEAVLHVRSHLEIRRFLLEQARIEKVSYLGNVFDMVQCPAVIVEMTRSKERWSTQGMKISDSSRQFLIQTDRKISPENFEFHMTDEEYRLIEKIQCQDHRVYLKDQADFAMGIVTGNNRELIQTRPGEDREMVWKGSDIQKYQIGTGSGYLTYAPEKFQQSAETRYYRAKEKLLYRFIGDKLVFAYDDRQRLSLNSCNILIPHVKGMEMKYILAVLNSRPAQFFYQMKFHSMKVLRSYLEQIPIPLVSQEKQREIIGFVEQITREKDICQWIEYYDRIDKEIAAAYDLAPLEYERIQLAEDSFGTLLR
ncbi:MAG: N-6 DNA methylase [Lachnospiraceae bacterium]|nr:N-6 DNA methylase [Lachnospiraceae bacterium]